MDIPESLSEEIRRGRAVLFLGAGGSKGAVRKDGRGVPDGPELGALIRSKFLGPEFPDLPLANLAEVAINEVGLGNVQEFIAEQFRDLEPAEFHLLVPKFVWYGIATTNYDLVLEDAYRSCEGGLQVLVPVSRPGKPIDEIARSAEQVIYLKLHGCITITDDKNSPLVLTSEQVITQQGTRERLYRTLVEWGHNHPVVFAGHNLRDNDLRVVLQDLDSLEEFRPPYYLVAPGLDPAIARYWGTRRMNVLDGTFQEFLTALDAKIPAEGRILVRTVARDHPIRRRLVSEEQLTESVERGLKTDLEYVHAALPSVPAEPRQFYRGFGLGWHPIQEKWDVRRKLVDTLLSEVILADEGDRSATAELIVIKAEAGAGKSILLRRLAWDAAVDFDAFCIRVRRHGQLKYQQLASLHRATKQRLFLFVDSAADRVDELRRLMIEARREGLPITVITAERANEWNMACGTLDPFLNASYPLRYLNPAEIEELIGLLDTHKCLFYLKDATHEERVYAFEKRAGRQLLVALHEATLGDPFEDILVDEFNSVRPQRAQSLYLTVCVLNRLGVPVRAGLISRTHGIAFEEFRERLVRPLEHVVRARMDDRLGDYVFVARHPYIAQIVFERILTEEQDRFNEYARLFRHMNLSYSTDLTAFRQLVKGRTLNQLFPNHEAVEELLDMAERLAPGDSGLLHQRALYEMRRPNGNLRKAHDLLKESQRKNERDSSVKHSLAELALIRSQNAGTAFEREKYRDECRSQAVALLRDERAGKHARHTLAKVLLDAEPVNDFETLLVIN